MQRKFRILNLHTTFQKYILKDVLPFIYVFIDDDIVVNMEHSITLFNNTYALLEIIYFGNFHYTSHVVDKNRGIWFYDGIKTCGSWATKWQNTIPECFLLLHYLFVSIIQVLSL